LEIYIKKYLDEKAKYLSIFKDFTILEQKVFKNKEVNIIYSENTNENSNQNQENN
jgi:hypothetical protein